MSHPEQGRPAAPAARGSFLITRAADSLVARLSRGRIYYGWYIVAAIFALETTTMGFNGLFFGIFLKPMSQEFGWTRAMTTGAVTAGTLAAATIGLFVGWVLDRYGPRWMITGGCVLLGASYFGLSRVNTILAFYLAYAVGRSIFQSALGRNMLNALTAKWFVRRRAIAIAFSSLGGILGGTVMAPVIQEIINRYGWREAWAFLGFLALSVAFLPSLLLLRRIPEDLGLRPDGDGRVETLPPGRQASSLGAVQAGKGIRILGVALRAPGATLAESNLTLPEAVRTPAFWLLCLVIAINVMATTGVTFHMVPHFTDIGIASTAAAASVSLFTIAQGPAVFFWGFAADRLGGKQALLGVQVVLVLGTFLVARARSAAEAYSAAMVFGVGMAGFMLVVDVVWANFFGRRHLGSIRGASLAFQLVGNASGSLIAALLYDWKGSYQVAFRTIILMVLASSAVLVLAKKPRPAKASAGE